MVRLNSREVLRFGASRAAHDSWTGGFEPPDLPSYLAVCGSTLIDNLSADEYRARYLGAAARLM